ncbi:hypothetical protein BLOT_011231 [Blomia tropicalis]|nr:hypothetical protein BLOT_011231 [Blomia tropicalis]
MKFFIVAFAAIVASASAVPAVVNTGHSAQFRSQDSLGNYAFGYNEDHATGGTFRRESGSPGIAQGSYGLRVADGRVRVVNYVADALGFRANIQTNEPGVEDQDPASVLINKAAAIVGKAIFARVCECILIFYSLREISLFKKPAPYIKTPVVAAAPIAAAAPLAIQQSYEAPIVQHYEPAPAVIEQAPIVQQKYEPAPAIIEQAPIVEQRYEPAPIVQQRYEPAAPIVQQRYEPAPAPAIYEHGPSPALISTYTTKTYAAPAPILSAAPAPVAYAGAYDSPAIAHGPLPSAYATKTIEPVGYSSASLLGVKAPLASPVLAAKTLGSIGYAGLIKK